MVGTGSRLFFAYTVLALLGAAVYGLASGGDVVGVLTLGYKGGVGEHFGYSVLVLLGASTLVLGLFSVVLRDADPDATAALQASDVLPEVAPPASASPWPLVGAFGLVVTALGLVVGAGLFVLGLVLLAVTAVEWAVQVWADRATGDPEVNRAIRNRLMAPLEIPVGAVLVILFVVLGISRVLLAVVAPDRGGRRFGRRQPDHGRGDHRVHPPPAQRHAGHRVPPAGRPGHHRRRHRRRGRGRARLPRRAGSRGR